MQVAQRDSRVIDGTTVEKSSVEYPAELSRSQIFWNHNLPFLSNTREYKVLYEFCQQLMGPEGLLKWW